MIVNFVANQQVRLGPEPYTAQWAAWLVRELQNPTLRELRRSNKDFRNEEHKAQIAFEDACNQGLIEYCNARKGLKGKPRYEFRLKE